MAAIGRSSRRLMLLPARRVQCAVQNRRFASTETVAAEDDVLSSLAAESSLSADPKPRTTPAAPAQPQRTPEERKLYNKLRPSDSVWRPPFQPPRYFRGPLHPVQPLPSTDPAARDFVPGPFNHPRLRQTYESTVESDLLTLMYQHQEPEAPEPEIKVRLRPWDDSSPYHKNRPLRPPRGPRGLTLLEKHVDPTNVPRILRVALVMYEPLAGNNKDHLLVARAVMQNLTAQIPETIYVKNPIQNWHTVKGRVAGVKAQLEGDAAYEFLDKCANFVFPRIKDWKGIKSTTGDWSGNVSWGFGPKDIILFPEIEANYDMYPPKLIPGCRVFLTTTATSDRQGRLLAQALGLPFYIPEKKERNTEWHRRQEAKAKAKSQGRRG